MQTKSGSDLRKLTRFPVNVKVFDEASEEPLGYTSNMHVEGMMLMSFTAIKVDVEYQIRLEYLGQDDELVHIRLTARCLWCKQADNPDLHHSGFYFSDINPEQHEMIVGLIGAMTKKS